MIRPTFLSFETAKRAITVSQYGLDTVGNNISNVSTPGYTRQRVDQVSVSMGGYATKYQVHNGVFTGQGVMATGVSQIRDPYLDTRYRMEASGYGTLATKINGLKSIEDVIDEVEDAGLSAQLEDFIYQLTTYANDTTDPALASVVRNSAQQLCQYLNMTANQLSNVQNNIKEELNTYVYSDLNAILEEIAYLNDRIREDHLYGNPSNELMDSRNMLIDQLSEYANIKVVNTPEILADGSAISKLSIIMVDSTTAPSSEFVLVDGKSFNTFATSDTADGGIKISLIQGKSGGVLFDDITGNLTAGALRGYVDLLNGKGDYAGSGENSFRGVQYYMKALDTFAVTLADTMNYINSITAAEAAGVSTLYEYLNKDLFVANGGGTVTAGNITISEKWLAEANYLTTTKQELQSKVPLLDENNLPVKDDQGNPVYRTDINNDNLNKMIELLKGSNSFRIETTDHVQKTLFTGSFNDFITDMQSDLGMDKKVLNTMLDATYTTINNYATMRDSVSAVNIDEEAINMMTYQNYYNAAARYMTALDEALGTIINSMGIVGR